ncbi:hypothetical protein [Nocardia aurantiaca]|uniref:Uncharacterized protein n=1 Tax=Nocardia aurantiaca TaxID=2675850 RepID=A0A6I3L6M3_9NOCA|nr:hypothetical protein [Nocardia aurantiaca]MTE15519.1 hypothetical protein [Nocardia aurantiaca]
MTYAGDRAGEHVVAQVIGGPAALIGWARSSWWRPWGQALFQVMAL